MSGVNGIGGGASGIREILALRQQIVDRSQLLQQIRQPAQTGGATEAGAAPNGFADSLKTALDHVSATQNRSEAISDAYEKGEVTDVAKVMLARQEAGVAFEATLQVRNRLLSAYQDIMRMGV
jgi:flagellar hook-basal body complex protein FliE